MLAVRIPDEVEKRLDRLAKLAGQPKSFYIRQAPTPILTKSKTPIPRFIGWRIRRAAGPLTSWNKGLTRNVERDCLRSEVAKSH